MNPFDRLAPYIKEFIWQQGWTELHRMQADAIGAILDTESHVLLTGGTASGKTEAALLPILTDLDNDPSSSVGVLYIGPLKALINDQFHRLEVLLEYAGINVWPWHGDVGQGVKRRAVEAHSGVLQTTPESLEGFFVYRKDVLPRLFGDLRYVVIDEVHAFMASDRGRQLLCQLTRLERLVGVSPRRVGLSATLGDYTLAETWLRGLGSTSVTTIETRAQGRKFRIGLDHFQTVPGRDAAELKAELGEPSTQANEAGRPAQDQSPDFILEIDRLARKRKSLLFVRSRADAEDIGSDLKELSQRNRMPDIYYVHHGSISKELRLDAEEAMRAEGKPACAIATVTLELGIDLGQLERVMQVGPSPSVSSFVQRMGRTGRRGQPGEMFFFSLEEAPDPTDSLVERIPWDFLLMIAQIQLYLEDRWVEPVPPPKLPYSLLYHQTMSVLLQHGELSPPQLAGHVLTLPPFSDVGQESYRSLLQHLLDTDHLERTEQGRLLIGLAGEKVVNDWRFLATFQDNIEYQVISGSEHIGSIGAAPPTDTVIRLAGRTWLVKAVDERQRIILVEASRGKARTRWAGRAGTIHSRVAQRLKQVLQEDSTYPYLQAGGTRRLAEARDLARSSGLLDEALQPLGSETTLMVPWLGSKAGHGIRLVVGSRLGWSSISSPAFPFVLSIKAPMSMIRDRVTEPVPLEELKSSVPTWAVPAEGKYDRFVPEQHLLDAYLRDGVDLDEATAFLAALH